MEIKRIHLKSNEDETSNFIYQIDNDRVIKVHLDQNVKEYFSETGKYNYDDTIIAMIPDIIITADDEEQLVISVNFTVEDDKLKVLKIGFKQIIKK